MSSLLLTVVLASSPMSVDAVTPESIETLAETLEVEVQTGTLLFSEGDCLAVKVFGGGPYTHVAAVVMRDGDPYVYDSANGIGVRCLPLARYLATQQPGLMCVMQPRTSFAAKRTARFRKSLDEQLGRPYGVKHHLTGDRAKGVHCAEYVTDALCEIHLIRARQPSRVSPASLAEGILEAELYAPTAVYDLTPAEEPTPEGDNWCHQMWLDTKTCTTHCCRQMGRWFLCR